MKLLTLLSLILIVFFKTGNLLSANNLFNVDNILLEKSNSSNKQLTNQAIQEAFKKLNNRILLKEDILKISNLKLSSIKELVAFYKISKDSNDKENKVSYSITFDKNKIHNLFYEKGILYSDISDYEFYILPILIRENQIYIFSNNYFYENWKQSKKYDLIEFILPLENIEVIQKINIKRSNLLNLDLNSLFEEFPDKNVAIALIEYSTDDKNKIYLKSRIQNKIFTKNLNIQKKEPKISNFKEQIILEIKEEIINLVKSQNLIDIRTPSFLNARFDLDNKNNLAILNLKINKIELIQNLLVQELNKNYVNLKIKYLGKLEKLKTQLKNENINILFLNDQWVITIL